MSKSFIIQEVEPADARGVAAVHALAWQTTYRGIIPDAVLDGMSEKAEYEKIGGELLPETKHPEIGGKAIAHVAYGWRDLSILLNPAQIKQVAKE
ncbi:hypothetical protein WDW86_16130 [Bdellovibrionota bacterium FG-2]